MNATARRIHSTAVALSSRARAELICFAHEGAELAAELAALEGEGGQAYREAREQLLAVRKGLIENLGACYFSTDADRHHALRSVIAWTAKRVAPGLRRELRAYARGIGVYS